jgi:Mn-dependent DtxR family transcriptional regulator
MLLRIIQGEDMLLQIRDYIRSGGLVSNQQLSREFRIEPYALQPMLDLLVRKGAIEKKQEQANCQSTCFKCRKLNSEYYAAIW